MQALLMPPEMGRPSSPPMPFTEWPYGGSTSLGVTRPNSVDSPLMTALANTYVGKALNDAHIQIYGWVNFGGNVSTNTVKPGGNWPAAFMTLPPFLPRPARGFLFVMWTRTVANRPPNQVQTEPSA